MKNKLNITQTNWLVTQSKNAVIAEEFPNQICTMNKDVTHFEDNAILIADAGTTYNECQILPSELLRQRNELLEALEEFRNAVYSENDIRVLAASQSAKELINKIKG